MFIKNQTSEVKQKIKVEIGISSSKENEAT